uniref:Oral cancer-overexpressed protein 1-like n=1 Tax=Sinocyclocheilus rhinocerous TaxID=307959 RepID=A0A673FSH3_9TELE
MAFVSSSDDLFDSVIMADDRLNQRVIYTHKLLSLDGVLTPSQCSVTVTVHVSVFRLHTFSLVLGFMMKGIRKGLRRELDREPSRVEITDGYTEPNSVHRKRLKAMESLIGLIQNFPYEDPQYEKLQEDMERACAKFRQVCSLLNLATEYVSGSTGMSF